MKQLAITLGLAFSRAFACTAILLLCVSVTAIAGPYPATMVTTYAGMVKPQRNVVNYTGSVIAYQYSTVHTGDYNGGSEGSGSHPGVDINEGDCQVTPIRAVGQGRIVAIVRDWLQRNPGGLPCGNNQALGFQGWGNYVIIEHDEAPGRQGYSGKAFSVYAHLYSVSSNVDANDKILRGTLLGYQGSTGGSTGSHLHFQLDRDRGGNHPYWPTDNVNSPDYIPNVQSYTYNAMRFVQAHIVNTRFANDADAFYFAGTNPTGGNELLYTTEPEIDNEWFLDGPPISLVNSFSARWEANVTLLLTNPPSSAWVFYVTSDDGARLWVNGQQVVDQWTNQSTPATRVGVINLRPGTYSVRLEYYESSGNATVQLAWQTGFNVYLPLIQK